jgi:glucokinase
MTVANTPSFPRLMGDVGGTNARFALQEAPGAQPTQVKTYAVADYANIDGAMKAYVDQVDGPKPRQGAVGIANPIVGDFLRMTNSPWAFSIEALRVAVGLDRLLFVNDFTALALSLPSLQPEHLRRIGSAGTADPKGAIGLLGAGTGLGVSGLLHDTAGHLVPLGGEGGHVSLAPATAREDKVVAALRDKFGHASAERALSGPGLENLYAAIAAIDQVAPAQRDAVEITRLALDRRCATSLAAVDMFCAMLGTVAGNLALTFRARGGVFIAGGIVPRFVDHLAQSEFRARFVAKGRFRDFLGTIPTTVIVNQDVAFLGLAAIARATCAR